MTKLLRPIAKHWLAFMGVFAVTGIFAMIGVEFTEGTLKKVLDGIDAVCDFGTVLVLVAYVYVDVSEKQATADEEKSAGV